MSKIVLFPGGAVLAASCIGDVAVDRDVPADTSWQSEGQDVIRRDASAQTASATAIAAWEVRRAEGFTEVAGLDTDGVPVFLQQIATQWRSETDWVATATISVPAHRVVRVTPAGSVVLVESADPRVQQLSERAALDLQEELSEDDIPYDWWSCMQCARYDVECVYAHYSCAGQTGEAFASCAQYLVQVCMLASHYCNRCIGGT